MDRFAFLILLGCGASHGPTDAEPDAGAFDASVLDASVPDASVLDVPMGPDALDAFDAMLPEDVGVDGFDAGPVATSGVPCGGVSCEAPIAVCVVCPHEEDTDAHCYPADLDAEWPFRTAMEEHGGCGFPGVFVQCDGPEDCGREDQECVFEGGEWGYAVCRSPTGGQIACRTDADCEVGVSCGEIDPFGYFSPHVATLGWRPHACGGASRDASAFCDQWDAACAGSPGFYDRAHCLRTHDDAWEGAEAECARRHIARGECEQAAGENPCDD